MACSTFQAPHGMQYVSSTSFVIAVTTWLLAIIMYLCEAIGGFNSVAVSGSSYFTLHAPHILLYTPSFYFALLILLYTPHSTLHSTLHTFYFTLHAPYSLLHSYSRLLDRRLQTIRFILVVGPFTHRPVRFCRLYVSVRYADHTASAHYPLLVRMLMDSSYYDK